MMVTKSQKSSEVAGVSVEQTDLIIRGYAYDHCLHDGVCYKRCRDKKSCSHLLTIDYWWQVITEWN